MKNRDKGTFADVFYMMGILTLFIGGFLLLTVFGATSYRNVVSLQKENNHERALNAYLSLTAQSNRYSFAGVYSDAAVDSEILEIEDGKSGFGFRIYNYNGNLVEDYGEIGSELWPADANILGENQLFKVEEVKDGLVAITTDEGVVYVQLFQYEGKK